MPAFRNRIWDGKIRLYSEQTGKIYVGLLPYIKQYCEKNNITINIDKGVEDVRNIVHKNVRDFIGSLRPKSKGKELEIRDEKEALNKYGSSASVASLGDILGSVLKK